MNVPKFLQEDLKLFSGIVSDLFPTIKEEDTDYGILDKAIRKACEKHNLKDVDGEPLAPAPQSRGCQEGLAPATLGSWAGEQRQADQPQGPSCLAQCAVGWGSLSSSLWGQVPLALSPLEPFRLMAIWKKLLCSDTRCVGFSYTNQCQLAGYLKTQFNSDTSQH